MSDIPVEQEINEVVKQFKPKFRSIHKTTNDDELCENVENLQHQVELNRCLTMRNPCKFVRVQTIQERWILIQLKDQCITCGWLLSEVIRKFNTLELDYDATNIIGFKTNNIHLDYHLSCLHLQLPNLDGVLLVPIIRQNLTEPINIEWFEIIKKLAAGGFSVVYLVRNKYNAQFYAMKVIDKRLMIERDKEEMIFNERQILAKLNNKRVINLFCAFQSKSKLYFVFDYCPGGELYFHLRKQKRFTEDQARGYIQQILEGLQYLHSQNIIYRDLKPENILIDQDGYLKITDFGLSKIVKEHENLNYSFCGSLEYMAPEMIQQSGHNYKLDYYQLGVLLYELIAGIPPFFAKTRQDMIKNIVTKSINYPHFFSKDLCDFISKLCSKDKNKRLTGEAIYQHPWIYDKKIQKIPIKYQMDTFNFEKLFINQQCVDIENGPRCIAEEFNITLSQSRDIGEEINPFEHFSSFYYKK